MFTVTVSYVGETISEYTTDDLDLALETRSDLCYAGFKVVVRKS